MLHILLSFYALVFKGEVVKFPRRCVSFKKLAISVNIFLQSIRLKPFFGDIFGYLTFYLPLFF